MLFDVVRCYFLHQPLTHTWFYRTESLHKCDILRQGLFAIPYAVSLVLRPCVTPLNVLYVREHNVTRYDYVNFTVCMAPLYILHDNAFIRQRLIEMIEVSRVFGAQRFTFYNISTPPQTSAMAAIEYYSKQGVMDVVQYHWPYTIRYDHNVLNGEQAAFMDCMLRNLYRSKYLAYFDIDEMLVPRSVDNWNDLFALPKLNNSCGLMFRNSFFYTKFPDDDKVSDDPSIKSPNRSILTLLKTKRSEKIWGARERSKSIGITRNIKKPTVHTLECRDGKIKALNITDGLLHHYRENISGILPVIHLPLTATCIVLRQT